MFTTVAKNLMLDTLAPTHVSGHSAFPGLTGANPLAGARVAITWNAASAGNLDSSNTPAIPVAAGETVRWIGHWDALTAGNFLSCSPNRPSGAPAPTSSYRVDTTNNLIDLPAHGYSNDQTITFYNGNPPAPLVEGTVYYVVGATTDTFQVSATQGGAAIGLTDAGDSTVRLSRILEETFAAAGTLTVSDDDQALNL